MGRKSNNREKILAVASRLFWTQGYEFIGLSDILKAANINKGTFYYFFPTKHELLMEILKKNLASTEAFLNELEELPPKERVLKYMENVRAIQLDEQGMSKKFAGCPIGNIGIEMAGRDEKALEGVSKIFDLMIRFISKAIFEIGTNKKKATSLAKDLFTHWEGALLMSKTSNHVEPYNAAIRFTENFLDHHVK